MILTGHQLVTEVIYSLIWHLLKRQTEMNFYMLSNYRCSRKFVKCNAIGKILKIQILGRVIKCSSWQVLSSLFIY